MENEEKDTLVGSGRNMETASDKYEEFADRSTGLHLPAFAADEEGVDSENGFSAPKKKRFSLNPALIGKKKIVAIALLLVLCAVGVFYFIGKKDNKAATPVGSESPIISAAMKAMQGVQSYSYAGTMSFKRTLKTAANEYGMEYQVIYNGVADKGTQGDPSAYSSVVYDTVRSAGENKRETSIGLESVIIGGKQYLKLDNLLIAGTEEVSKAATLESGLKGFSGSWYLVSDENYGKFYTEVKDYAFLPDDLNLLDVKSVDDFNEVFNHKLLTSPQDMGTEAVGEIETSHYKVGLNTRGAIEFISSLAEKGMDGGKSADMTKILQELKTNSQEDDKFKKMVDYVMQNVGIEIWIGKNDNLIHRFRISGAFDRSAIGSFYDKLGEVYGGSYASKGEDIKDESMNFDIDYTLSGFDSAKVREPEGAKDFTEVIERLKSLNPDMAVTASSSSAVDTDTDGLSDEQEKIYGSDANKSDTDGDGYSDGAKVKGGYDPVVSGSARLDYSKLNKTK